MKVPIRIVVITSAILSLLFLGYSFRSRYRDPWYTNFDDGSDWPSLEEQNPSKTAADKVVVMAKVKTEDTEWVGKDLPDWGHAIYHMDEDAGQYHPPQNKGREAMAYLTYLIDTYSRLPATVAFIHPHKNGWPVAWHTDATDHDNARSLQDLKIEYVQDHGYANLRCIHDPGCPAEIIPFRDPPDADRTAEHAMAEAYIYMFGGDNSTVPTTLATPCCSQFAVSKKQVLQRPQEDYIRVRQWLIDTPLDDDTSGRVMEYIWHVLFGRDAVHCPQLYTCWCEQFGRC